MYVYVLVFLFASHLKAKGLLTLLKNSEQTFVKYLEHLLIPMF